MKYKTITFEQLTDLEWSLNGVFEILGWYRTFDDNFVHTGWYCRTNIGIFWLSSEN